MDLLTFIIDFLNVVVWPVTAVVIVLILRKHVAEVIDLLLKNKSKDSKSDHHKKL